jgi:hypothetical protein
MARASFWYDEQPHYIRNFDRTCFISGSLLLLGSIHCFRLHVLTILDHNDSSLVYIGIPCSDYVLIIPLLSALSTRIRCFGRFIANRERANVT